MATSPFRLALLAAPLVLGLAACSGSSADSADDRPTVVAGFYPLAYAAQQVGGDSIRVVNLTPPGAEAHDLELGPQQVAEIGEADLVLYIPGFQPALDEAIAQGAADRALDVTQALDVLPADDRPGADGSLAGDPHVWLNPLNMAAIGAEIAQRLTALGTTGDVTAGEATLSAEMTALDEQWSTGTRDCRSRDLVVSHEAFGYLASRYGFAQVGIAGLSPEAEPSPARIAEVADLVREKGITTIYYETLVDPGVAETLAAETGAETAVLDPIEGLGPDSSGDYVSLMRANLETVRTGQGCR